MYGGNAMKSLNKKLLCIAFSAILCVPMLSSNAFASDINSSNSLTKLPILEQIKSNGINSNKSTDIGIITITDKGQIAEIAKEQNLNDPESITKITYEFHNFSNIQESQQIENNANANSSINSVTSTQAIYNVKDLGTGYSYWDQYDSSIYDGPAEVTKTYTRTASSSYSANIKVDYKIIEAAVGFTFTSGQQVSEAYKLSVPANKKIELRIFTNYQKKSYDIGDNYGGLIYNTGSGTAQKPVGLIFQQIQR